MGKFPDSEFTGRISGRVFAHTTSPVAAMNTPLSPQERMNAAFDNYFELSDILQKDLLALLNPESVILQSKSRIYHFKSMT
jgi:hypothetical protein